MKFNILTLFPEAIKPYLDASILGRAQNIVGGNGIAPLEIKLIDIRDYTSDKHKTVDDTPYGGGAGMVMKVEPIYKCLKENNLLEIGERWLMSAKGKTFEQKEAKRMSGLDEITLICGRYEGVDQRVADNLCTGELSVGSYVLAGGELPALTVVESVARLLPGVLGNEESLSEESHGDSISQEYPQYTKPEEFNGWKVPGILLSGNHADINNWRKNNSK